MIDATKEKLLKIFYTDSACVGFWTLFSSLWRTLELLLSWPLGQSLSPLGLFWTTYLIFWKTHFSNQSNKGLIKQKSLLKYSFQDITSGLIKSTRVWKDLNFKYPLSCYHLLDTILMFVFFYFVRFWVMSINGMCLYLLVGDKDCEEK